MDAARVLGISSEDYDQALDRVSNVERNSIDDGVFRPYRISRNINEAFQTNADAIGVPNPLYKAYAAIEKIDNQLSTLTLDELFPDIQNPLIPMGLGMPFTTPGGDTNALSSLNLPGVNPQAVNAAGQANTLSGLTNQQKIDILFGRS